MKLYNPKKDIFIVEKLFVILVLFMIGTVIIQNSNSRSHLEDNCVKTSLVQLHGNPIYDCGDKE
jgi:hypothetical protein